MGTGSIFQKKDLREEEIICEEHDSSQGHTHAFVKPFPTHHITVSNPSQTHSQMDQNCGLFCFPHYLTERTEMIYHEKADTQKRHQ